MRIEISDIRADYNNPDNVCRLGKLVDSMREKGLQHPITVTLLYTGRYYLLDGLRRIDAAVSLGWTHIESKVVSAWEAERCVCKDMDEIKQKRRLTIGEVTKYSRMLITIKRDQFRESMFEQIKNLSPLERSNALNHASRSYTAKRLGIKTTHLLMAAYVLKHSTEDIIMQVDNGDKKIVHAYYETKAMLSSGNNSRIYSEEQEPAVQTSQEAVCQAISPDGAGARIAELEQRVQDEYYRANIAEGDMRDLRESHRNQIYHRDSIIDSLKAQVRDLQSKLESQAKDSGRYVD